MINESNRPHSYSLATKGSKPPPKVLSAETEEQVNIRSQLIFNAADCDLVG